ncbi:MAG: 30S ribosomal protein S15 [Rickettsiaceae bacterium]|nr:MAG: 30S ribosomal protein S15 [Rickettsiaceae bacterium]
MSITMDKKQELIAEFAISQNDTGSVYVQCAILTKRINSLTEHFKTNHKDCASRRGLLMMVGRRRRLLDYLKRKNLEAYKNLIAKLGIRK